MDKNKPPSSISDAELVESMAESIEELENLIAEAKQPDTHSPPVLQTKVPILTDFVNPVQAESNATSKPATDTNHSDDAFPVERINELMNSVDEKLSDEIDSLVDLLKDTIKDSIMDELKEQIKKEATHAEADASLQDSIPEGKPENPST